MPDHSPVPTTDGYRLGLLTAGHFLSDFYVNFLPVLLPLLITRLHLSLTTSGMVVMIFSLASNIVQPLFGYYVDKTGQTRLVLAVFTVGGAAALLGFAGNLTITIFLLILTGLSSALFHPLGSALVAAVTAPPQRNLAMSIFIGTGNFGFALAPMAVVYFMLHYGDAALPWLIIPGLVLTTAYFAAGLHHAMPVTTHDSDLTAHDHWYESRDLLLLNLVMALRSWAQVAVPMYLPVLLAAAGQPATLAGTMITVFLLGGAIGGLAGGYAGDRWGKKRCIFCALALCVPVLHVFLKQSNITWLSWLTLFISGGALQATLPSSIVWAQEIIPRHAAMASGMMLGLAFGLGGLGTAVTGAMADHLGLLAALQFTVLPVALAAALVVFVRPTTVAASPVKAAARQP